MESDKTVSLEWTGHGQALSTGIWNLFKQDFLVDTSVKYHGQCVRVHKLVLSIFLPILKESLLKADQPSAIDLDVLVSHADDVQYLLEFIYTGKVREIPEKHLSCLMNVAESMGIDALADTIRAQHPITAAQVDFSQKMETTDMMIGANRHDVDVDAASGSGVGTLDDLQQSLSSTSKVEDVGLTDGMLRRLLALDDVVVNTKSNETVAEADAEAAEARPPSPRDLRSGVRANRRYTLRPGSVRKKPAEVVSIPDDDDDDNDDDDEDNDVDDADDYVDDVTPPKVTAKRRCKAAAAPAATKRRKRRSGEASKKSVDSMEAGLNAGDGGGGSKPGAKRIGMERLQKCNFCNHSTWQKNVLVQHLAARHKVDLKGNPLPDMKCSYDGCDFVCVARHQLNQHTMRKHGEKKNICSLCSYTSVFSSDFKKHVQIQHLKKRDFMCDVCGFRSQTKGGLNAHARTHDRIKPLKCEACGAEYSDTLSYRLHVQNHTGNVVNTYVCHCCGHGCRRRSQLRIHLRKKHNIELESGRRKYGSIETTTTTTTSSVGDANGPDTSASSSVGAAADFLNPDSDSARASMDTL